MGAGASTSASPVVPEGTGCVIYDQNGVYGNDNGDRKNSGSVHTIKGGKNVNQDAAVLCQGYGTEDGVLCGVFDGHGKFGHTVSRIVRQRLPVLLLDQKIVAAPADTESDDDTIQGGLSSSDKKLLDWEEAFVKTFEEMDKELKHTKKMDFSFSGSTAVVALKQGDDFFIANLGDSRAVLGTKTESGVTPLQLTTDLKPGTPDEADRIKKNNGRVFALREEPGVVRAWLPRLQCPGIAMSRCFGDFVMKRHGLISTPVVTHHRITSDDRFIVLATDGVWDVLSNEEVVSIVSKVEKEEMASQALVQAALVAWRTRLPGGRPDDCTALCLFLHDNDQTPSTTPQSSLSR